MTTRAQLNQAQALSAELDRVTAALAIVADGTFTQVLEIASPSAAGVRVTTSVSANNLTTMLTARQAAIQSALGALGVT